MAKVPRARMFTLGSASDIVRRGADGFWRYIIDNNHAYPTGRIKRGGITDKLLGDYPNLYGDLSANSGSSADRRNFTVPQAFDIPHGRLAEEAAVLTAELAYALVTDLVRRTLRIKAIRQHALPGCL